MNEGFIFCKDTDREYKGKKQYTCPNNTPKNREKMKSLLERLDKIGLPYKYYHNDQLLGVPPRQGKTLNCRDKAPHEDEINALAALGLSYPQIRRIIENKYYRDILE